MAQRTSTIPAMLLLGELSNALCETFPDLEDAAARRLAAQVLRSLCRSVGWQPAPVAGGVGQYDRHPKTKRAGVDDAGVLGGKELTT